MNRNKCVIVVPIYKEKFNFDEYNSIKQLFKILPSEKYDIIAYGPETLDRSYYFENFPFTDHYYFWDSYFTNYPIGYNSLMLQSGFYECFDQYEFMFVYQPDCWVFKDELEYWCEKGYDFIGPPIFFTYDNDYWLSDNSRYTNLNGGFSLRKIKTMIDLCKKFYYECYDLYSQGLKTLGEDHIFQYLLDKNNKLKFNLPSFIDCAKFGFETNPHYCYQTIDFKLPFGCHAYKNIQAHEFWDNFIFYDKKLYSVVTYLFGDYDILRDPDEIDEGAEYICLTDRDDLKSDVWTFKKLNYPNIEKYNDWQKTLIARYTALDYINTDICLQIDASVHIKKPSLKLIHWFKAKTLTSAYLLHPWRDNYNDEYDEWINTRNLDPIQKDQFFKFAQDHGYDASIKGMIMTTIMIKTKCQFNINIDNYVLHELMNNNNFNQRVDQTYYSIIVSNNWRCDVSFLFLSMQILDSDYFEFYYHNSNITHSNEYKCDLDKIDYKYFCGKLFPCLYL